MDTVQKISDNRKKKEGLIAEFNDKVSRSTGMVFTQYQGLTHIQLEGLKKAVKKVDADFVATKNTLILRALAEKDIPEAEKGHFKNPTATLFIYGDPVEPIKVLAKSLKEVQLPAIKFGLVNGRIVTDKEVVRLSTLPPLPVLRAQVLGQMKAPIQGLHRALSWNMQTFVMTLNAIAQKKS